MLTTSQQDRITALQPYLDRIAHNLIMTYYHDRDPQDLLQEMNLCILERAETDPAFLGQTDSYICNSAAWKARCSTRSDRNGVNHGWRREAFSLDAINENGIDNAELFAAETPDAGIALDVRAALSTLSSTTQLVARLIVAGFKGQELADRAGLSSKQAVSYHRRLIKAALAPVAGQ